MPHYKLSDYGLVDQDNVLADFDRPTWDLVIKHGLTCDVEPHLDNQRHRFMTDHLPRNERKVIRDAVFAPGWFSSLPVMPGAIEGMKRLLDAADDNNKRLIVVTKPLEGVSTSDSEKRSWLREHFPDVAETATMAYDKSLVAGAWLLDDAIKPAWLQRALWTPVVFDRPYNGVGSIWEGWHRWDWSRPVNELHPMFANVKDHR